MRAGIIVLGTVLCAASATAQEFRLAELGLPRDAEQRVRFLLQDPATRRFSGGGQVSAEVTIRANVVSTDGPFSLAGRVEGELVVIGGDLDLAPGSFVSGDVTVIGGDALGLEQATIRGTFTAYGEGFELYHRGEPILVFNTARRRRSHRSEDRSWGFSNLTLRAATNYNRVEGLPVAIGPVIQTGGSSPTRVEAVGILRTASSDLFGSDQMGYQFRAEQFLGSRALRIGATLRSVTEPIEAWNLSTLEASLATFVLHEDQRDYYAREGWGAYVRWTPRSLDLSADVGYWDEEFDSRAARDPWTLFGNGAWRAQPLIGEGRLKGVTGRIEIDSRDEELVPTSGVLLRVQATRGLEGSIQLPGYLDPFADSAAPALVPPVAFNPEFTTGLVDVRVYRRVNRAGTLALRGVAGGSFTDQSLPPQFQHALGGAGTLPGYGLFAGDCGARNTPVRLSAGETTSFYSSYGCDRFVFGSVEYRGGFRLDFGGDFDFWGGDDEDRNWHIDANPNWMLFFDAGQGWALNGSRTLGATNTGLLYDAGAGIMLGNVGAFAAIPLSGEDRDVRFFVRLGARF